MFLAAPTSDGVFFLASSVFDDDEARVELRLSGFTIDALGSFVTQFGIHQHSPPHKSLNRNALYRFGSRRQFRLAPAIWFTSVLMARSTSLVHVEVDGSLGMSGSRLSAWLAPTTWFMSRSLARTYELVHVKRSGSLM
jgi:hypothetical protein